LTDLITRDSSCKTNVKKGDLILLAGTAVILLLIVSWVCDYDNMVIFTGDEWDYQSIGVNGYNGAEFLTTGRIGEIDDYRFTGLDNGKISFWESFSGKKAYHRVPFYPMFISVSYKLFGINPVIIKYIQLTILLISGLLLSFAGKLAWGNRGFWIGYLSFIIFVGLNYRFTEHLMPENWQFLFLAVIIISLFYHYRNRPIYSVVLGLTLGLSCLNKGTTFILFPLILISDLYYWWVKDRTHWKRMVLFCTMFILITGLWSVYISIERNQFTFLSVQTGEVILDGNNEFCIDGLWHPEWRERPDSYYNNDNLENMPGVIRAGVFYVKHPECLSNFAAKIKAGFAPVPSFIALMSLFLIWLATVIYRDSGSQKGIRGRVAGRIFALFSVCLSICFVLFSGAMNSILFTVVVVSIALLPVFCGSRFRKEIKLPFEFLIILLNFLIFTLAFYVCNETYPSRYVKTMDGILILLCFYFLSGILENFKKGIVKAS